MDAITSEISTALQYVWVGDWVAWVSEWLYGI